MKRPYDIDEDGIVHLKEGNCQYTPTGDSNRDGIITGMIEDGYGLCNECLFKDEMMGMYDKASERLDYLY